MAQLVPRRHRGRYNQPKRPSPLPSPPPTPGGDIQPTSLFRRPDKILLPDGRRISIYEVRHGVLVTDSIRGSTRPVEDVYMEVLYDLQTRPRDPPPSIAEPVQRRHRGRDAHKLPIRCILPDNRIIHAYNDRHGVLVTDDIDGLTRPVRDVCREVLCDLWMRPRHPPRPVADAAEEDQPAPQQTACPSPGPSKAQFVDDPLNMLCVFHKLKLAQRREDRKQNVLALKELLHTTTLEESSITNASSVLQPTPSGSDMLSSKALLIVKATLGKSSIMDASSTRAEAVTHLLTPPVSSRKPVDWNHQFFIRVDRNRVFHTYPKLSGPFQSLEEAEKAILRRLDELRDPKMCTNNGLSSSEIAIRDALYWPDGARKYSSSSNPDRDHIELLVQALLDKYNEENKLLGDAAYHVKNIMSFQEVYEGKGSWYYHLNCTRKTEVGIDALFFAEVLKIIRGQHEEFELTCLHMIKPAVDNGPCYGCKENNVGMKHPTDAGQYRGGHDPSWPRCGGDFSQGLPKDVNARMKLMEERIRNLFQDPDAVKSDAGSTAATDASTNEGRIRYLFGVRHVAKADAGRTAASLEGKRVKYVVPARRQLV